MNNLSGPEFYEIARYGWLAIVSFTGGVIGYFRKQWQCDIEKSKSEKIRSALLSIITSMFVAYILYELLMHCFGIINISVAFAGLASFAGTDLLVTLEKGLITKICKFINVLDGDK